MTSTFISTPTHCFTRITKQVLITLSWENSSTPEYNTQIQKELLKPDRLHHLSYYQRHSIKGEKKVYTDFPEKTYPCVGPGPLFKENSKCLALLQEENKCTFGLSHLAKKVIVAQLSFGTTCVCTDLGNATCPSKCFLPVTWRGGKKKKGVQMQNFNIKEEKGFSLGGLDITRQPCCLSIFFWRQWRKRKQKE